MIRPVKHSGHNLDVMLAKAIQTQPFGAGIYFSVSAHLLVTMRCCPFRDVGMKALAIFYHRREQPQLTALARLGLEPPTKLVARLRFYGQVAIRAILRPQPREQQPDEMVNFGDRGDRALAAAAAGALFDADS